MNEEQAEVLIEELLQLKLEIAELRREAKVNARLVSVPHFVAAGIGALMLMGALLWYATL